MGSHLRRIERAKERAKESLPPETPIRIFSPSRIMSKSLMPLPTSLIKRMTQGSIRPSIMF